MRQTTQQRFAILATVLPMFSIFGVRAAKDYDWIPSRGAAIAFAAFIGLFCIGGGIIAYVTTQRQVRRDLDEIQNIGKTR